MIIFRAENLNFQWIPASIAGDWRFACNSKGWTSNEHGLDWLRHCFEPETREKANGAYRLLICDGHDSHITGELIAHCMDNNIILMILPPHTSHLTQPLDVGVFGPLKKVMSRMIAPLISLGVSRIQKVEWTTAFVHAHEAVFNAQNIQGGFRGAGIFPFKPDKVLHRITLQPMTTTPPPPQNRESTPLIDTPFNNSVLTSSPVDFNAVHDANIALNARLASGESLDSPARNYVNCITRTNERLHASNIILQKENEDLRTTLTKRKERLGGKRKIIKGKHCLSVAEIRDDISKAQKATKKRAAPKGAKGRKRPAKVVKGLRDDYDSYSEQGNDEEVEILDCIEIEM